MPNQLPQDAVSSQRSVYMISGASPKQSDQESVSSCECHHPGPSTSSLHQIPGLLMIEHDEEIQIPPPIMHNTIMQPGETRQDEPVIPELGNHYRRNSLITRRVTSMLFMVTLVFFGTYFISSLLALIFRFGLVRQFCRDFVLINHAINPVIYSIANEGFRERCIGFVHRIRERIGF